MPKLIGLKAKHARIARMRPQAKAEVLGSMVREVINTIDRIAPHDTNRYRNGWIQAGRAAGITGTRPHPLSRGKYRTEILVILRDQVRRMEDRVKKTKALIAHWYKDGRKRTGYFNKLRTRLRQDMRRLERAQEELDKFRRGEAVILFDASRSKGRRLSTVRDKVYGGTGRTYRVGDRTLVELHNMEPHSRIVEQQHGTLAKANGTFKGSALRKIGKGYIRKLAAAAR